MKVILDKEAKKYITLEQAPIVREIIVSMKEDESTVEEYAEMAIRAAYDGNAWNIDMLRAKAKIFRNCRVWNAYNNNSSDLDIWIDAIAYVNRKEFIIIGAYLSDIWQLSPDRRGYLSQFFYVRKFSEYVN